MFANQGNRDDVREAVGKRIWELLDQGYTATTVADTLVEENWFFTREEALKVVDSAINDAYDTAIGTP